MPTDTPILDERGRVMFRCGVCGGAISAGDFFQLGLRLPSAASRLTSFARRNYSTGPTTWTA